MYFEVFFHDIRHWQFKNSIHIIFVMICWV